ncbi:MAG: hypothetical protein JST55_09050 [Bacteroidetes bacterium]|nr:hypothetical protein [Bacteroidota bacterium]
MKKILLSLFALILFLNFYSNSYSQSFAVGYRVGSGSFKPLDFVIGRYNDTRTAILTKKMDKISSISGVVYSVGYNFGEGGFELEIPNLKSETVSSETSTQIREVYMKMTGLEFNFSYGKQVFQEGSLFGFIGGALSVDKADASVFTRIYDKTGTAGEFKEVKADGSVNMGIGPFVGVHLLFPSVIIFGEVRPFYKFSITSADFFDVNAALNPNTWYNDDIDDTKGSMNYLGVNAKIGITVAIF